MIINNNWWTNYW